MAVVSQMKQAKFSKKKIKKIIDLACQHCDVTPEEVKGEAEMSLENQVKVSTYVYSQTGLVLDYGEVVIEPLDAETLDTVFNEVYDTNTSNRKIKRRLC